jgi:putative transposase
MLEPLANHFPRMQLIWGDSHYSGTLIAWVKEQLGWEVQVVHGLGTVPDARTQTSQRKEKGAKGGFNVLPRRWVVERSFAWITRWRRLALDHEGLPESSEAFIKLSASRRMLSHLAPAFA